MPEKWKKWTQASPVTDEMMLERWTRLVCYIAKTAARSYKLKPEDVEDIESEMKLRLLRCPQDKRQYEGYVRQVITNSVRSGINSVMARGCPQSMWRGYSTVSYREAAPPRDRDADDAASDADRAIGGTPHPESGLVDNITLAAALAALPEREREVMIMYAEGLTAGETASELGCSHKTAYNLRAAAINKLRKKKGILFFKNTG